ncbi:NAD(P)-binding domain-containing protein [Paraburkholderia aspalathi]|nr:NAD(P)-binding domain-containing protein [Paraburkholderia aspalathi]
MKIAIIGAGAIAFATAAYLQSEGHIPVLWSPSGKSTADFTDGASLTATGLIESQFQPDVAGSAKEAVETATTVIIAMPLNAHKKAIDAIYPHLNEEQNVIISSHASFSALYLSKKLAERHIAIPITAWSTTAFRARKKNSITIQINTIRKTIDIATVPVSCADKGLATCIALFGERFNQRSDLLAVTLSNINPQSHMALALCNFTRMELAEQWDQNACSTPSVANLIDELDQERMAIGKSFNVKIRTLDEHQKATYGTGATTAPVTFGPQTIQTRYVLEDVPFGLSPIVRLGQLADIATPLHRSGITIFSALYGQNIEQDNDLLEDVLPEGTTKSQFAELIKNGWPI